MTTNPPKNAPKQKPRKSVMATREPDIYKTLCEMQSILTRGNKTMPAAFGKSVGVLQNIVQLEVDALNPKQNLNLTAGYEAQQLHRTLQRHLYVLDELLTNDSPPDELYVQASLGVETDAKAVEIQKLDSSAQDLRIQCLRLTMLTNYLTRNVCSSVMKRVNSGRARRHPQVP